MSDVLRTLNNKKALITKTAPITTTSQVIAPARENRIGLIIWNPTGNSIYISLSDNCNPNSQSAIVAANSNWVLPVAYTGPISCTRNAGSGAINVTEIIG